MSGLVNFDDHRSAAMAAITSGFNFSRKEGGFLGHMCFDEEQPSARQWKWLNDILRKTGLPGLAGRPVA